MQVSETTDFQLLSVFGDKLPHSWFEVIYLATIYLDTTQNKMEKLLQRAVVDNNWIKRSGIAPALKQDTLELTAKGDEYLRYMAIRRQGDPRYYKYFNRQEESSGFTGFGLDKFAPLDPKLKKLK